jgi:hypothetical protein
MSASPRTPGGIISNQCVEHGAVSTRRAILRSLSLLGNRSVDVGTALDGNRTKTSIPVSHSHFDGGDILGSSFPEFLRTSCSSLSARTSGRRISEHCELAMGLGLSLD